MIDRCNSGTKMEVVRLGWERLVWEVLKPWYLGLKKYQQQIVYDMEDQWAMVVWGSGISWHYSLRLRTIQVAVKSLKTEARLPRFIFQLHHLLAMRLWTRSQTFLCLIFLICKIGKILLTSNDHCKENVSMHVKHLEKYMVHTQRSLNIYCLHYFMFF